VGKATEVSNRPDLSPRPQTRALITCSGCERVGLGEGDRHYLLPLSFAGLLDYWLVDQQLQYDEWKACVQELECAR
jgi:hypothetical protein